MQLLSGGGTAKSLFAMERSDYNSIHFTYKNITFNWCFFLFLVYFQLSDADDITLMTGLKN